LLVLRAGREGGVRGGVAAGKGDAHTHHTTSHHHRQQDINSSGRQTESWGGVGRPPPEQFAVQ